MAESLKRQPRETVRAAIIAQAEILLERDGSEGLKARPIAEATGISVGTVYNMFGSLDEVIMAINAKTFDRLRVVGEEAAALLESEVSQAGSTYTVATRLMRIADAYMRFVRENENRWSAVASFNRRHADPLPNWYRIRMFGLFNIIEGVLKDIPVFTSNRRQRSLVARALFSSVNGIVSSAIGAEITQAVVDNIRDQTKIIVCAVVAQFSGAPFDELQASLDRVPH